MKLWVKAFIPIMLLLLITGCDNGTKTETKQEDTSVTDNSVWEISGSTFSHDPTMIYAEGKYHQFYTAPYITHKTSKDGKRWVYSGTVFTKTTTPSWINASNCVVNESGDFEMWAPDVSKVGDIYYMYYNVSLFGTNTSTIALIKSSNLVNWEEVGTVISSDSSTLYNCIDANLVIDNDNKYWLSFGSFFDGIYIVEIDPSTMLIKDGSVPTQIAKKNEQEAPFIWNPGNGYYYLITSVGKCCKGLNSTYKIEYGRSTSIKGPYLDMNGKDLKDGGGTILLNASGSMIGPGGQCVIKDASGNNVLVHHFYDGKNNGTATLSIRELSITSGKWLSVAGGVNYKEWDTTENGKVSAAGTVKQQTIPALSVNADTGYYVEFTFNESYSTELDWKTNVLSYLGYNVTIPNLDSWNNTDDSDSTLNSKNAYPTIAGCTLTSGYEYDSAYTGNDVKIKITFKSGEGIKYYLNDILAYYYTTALWNGAIDLFIEKIASGISSGNCVFNSAQYNMKDVTIGVLN